MNIAQKIAKETSITFSGMLYGNINRYIYTALLARWVGIEYLGIYSLANAIMLIGEVIARVGLETGVMRFISQLDRQKENIQIHKIIYSSLKITIIFSLGIVIIIIIASKSLVSIFNGIPLLHKVIIIFALVIPFNAITLVAAYATQGFKLLKYKVLTTQVINPTILLFTMIIAYRYFSLESVIIAPMVCVAITGCVIILILLRKISGINFYKIVFTNIDKDLFKFSFPLMFVAILQTLMHWMDILMLGYFTDPIMVGLYHPAARTAGLLQAILLSFMSIYAPIISQLHAKKDLIAMSSLYKLISRWLMTFSIPIVIIFFSLSHKIMLLFGVEYVSSSNVLILLTIATFFQTFLGAAGPILSMTGYTNIVFWNTIIAFILNIILNIILIPQYGILGAAWATLISLSIIGVIRVIEVKKILGLSLYSYKLFKPITAGAITYVLVIIVRTLVMEYHTLITLLLISVFTFISYGFVLWILRFELEDYDFLSGLNIFNRYFK